MHGEMESKARIILILALAKWQFGGCVTLLIIKIMGASMHNVLSLTFRSEGEFSLLSVKEIALHLLRARGCAAPARAARGCARPRGGARSRAPPLAPAGGSTGRERENWREEI